MNYLLCLKMKRLENEKGPKMAYLADIFNYLHSVNTGIEGKNLNI